MPPPPPPPPAVPEPFMPPTRPDARAKASAPAWGGPFSVTSFWPAVGWAGEGAWGEGVGVGGWGEGCGTGWSTGLGSGGGGVLGGGGGGGSWSGGRGGGEVLGGGGGGGSWIGIRVEIDAASRFTPVSWRAKVQIRPARRARTR